MAFYLLAHVCSLLLFWIICWPGLLFLEARFWSGGADWVGARDTVVLGSAASLAALGVLAFHGWLIRLVLEAGAKPPPPFSPDLSVGGRLDGAFRMIRWVSGAGPAPAFLLVLLAGGLCACASGIRLDYQAADGSRLRLTQLRSGDRSAYEERHDLPGGIVLSSGGVGENHSTQTRHVGRMVTGMTSLISAAYVQAQQLAADLGKARAAEETSRLALGEQGATARAGLEATASTAQSLGNNPEANTGAIEAVGGLYR